MPLPWAGIIDAGASLVSSLFGSKSQDSANRTNIKLQREAQAYNTQMSNTAVQRRKADIEAAGGNPALAFVNGQEASSQTIAPAQVDPFKPDVRTNFSAAALNRAQIQNLATASGKNQADTALALAQAELTKTNKAALEAQTGATLASTTKTGAETQRTRAETAQLDTAKRKLLAEISNLTTQGQLLAIERDIKNATKAETISLVKNHLAETTASAKKAGLVSQAVDAFNNTTKGIGDYLGDKWYDWVQTGRRQQDAILNSRPARANKFQPQRSGR